MWNLGKAKQWGSNNSGCRFLRFPKFEAKSVWLEPWHLGRVSLHVTTWRVRAALPVGFLIRTFRICYGSRFLRCGFVDSGEAINGNKFLRLIITDVNTHWMMFNLFLLQGGFWFGRGRGSERNVRLEFGLRQMLLFALCNSHRLERKKSNRSYHINEILYWIH